MIKNYLKIIENNNDSVIITVLPRNTMEIIKTPYLPKNISTIIVTKGKNHTIYLFDKDIRKASFNWGLSGHTLISSSLQKLKKEIIAFLETNNIFIEIKGKPYFKEISIFNTPGLPFESQISGYTTDNQHLRLTGTRKEMEQFLKEHFKLSHNYHADNQAAATNLDSYTVISHNLW